MHPSKSSVAIALVSGGLDSATALAIAQDEGYRCIALSFDYKQNNVAEVAAAKRVVAQCAVTEHTILTLPFDKIKGSALTDPSIPVPDYTDDGLIPVTYVPARNTIFLSFALGLAEVINADAIFAGFCAVDYAGYPDCRPEYIAAYQRMADLANKRGIEGRPVQLHAPLVDCSKAEIIQIGTRLGLNYADTVSCYRANSDGLACGRCDSCHYRREGFRRAGLADTTRYA